MHPIVIIVFIFAGLGGAYWLVNNLGAARNAATGTAVSVVATYGNLIIKALFLVTILYAVWVLVDTVRGASQKRKARENLQKF
jgi:hypothetical protein